MRTNAAKVVQITTVGVLALAGLTFVCYQARVDLASAIPAYMLLVVAQSLTGDFYSAAVVSVLSAACLDFFFTEPRFSLYVSSLRQVISLIVFILTALVITRLVSRERKETRASELQKDRLARLYDLSQELLALKAEMVMSEKFLEPFQKLFGVTAICAFDADTAELHAVGVSTHQIETRTREAYIRGRDLDDPSSNLSVRCLRVGGTGRMTGAIGLEGLNDSYEASGQLAILSAMLVQRTKAFRQASVSAAAAQAETFRSAVLDALAHEFKTPLTTILAAAGAIRDAGSLQPEQDEMAATVEHEATRLSGLTSRLLRTARLDREEIKPQLELTDVSPIAAGVVEHYATGSQDRYFRFADSNQSAEVLADPGLLRIALNQLVENACKYSVPDSTVAINVETGDQYVAIKVTNDGSSIPYKERERIFERFYRGTNATRSTSGSGLGLYIARRIAIAHGGALELESQERSTSIVTFCLRIPVLKEAHEDVLTT